MNDTLLVKIAATQVRRLTEETMWVNKLGQVMAFGGAAMAALLQHFNNNAAAYSVIVGMLGLGITALYHLRKDRREAALAKAQLEAIRTSGIHTLIK